MDAVRLEFCGEEFCEYVTVSKKTRKTGKPRRVKINSQNMYSGMNHHLRSKIVKEIKKLLYTKIRSIDFISETPIRLDIEVHYPLGEWDMGNKLYLWRKCFEDALCGNVDFYTVAPAEGKVRSSYIPMRDKYPAKIEDDNVSFITEYGEKYIEVSSLEERKLVFILSTIKV